MADIRICKIEGCGKPMRSRGLCGAHYVRLRRNGDPLVCKSAANGETEAWLRRHVEWTGDDCLPWPFGQGAYGYAGGATIAGDRQPAYRQMCRLAHGEPPTPAHQVAHSCGKGA